MHLVDAGAAAVHARQAQVALLQQARNVLHDAAARPAAFARQGVEAAKALALARVGVAGDGEQDPAAGAREQAVLQDVPHEVEVDVLRPGRGYGRAGVSHDEALSQTVEKLSNTAAKRWWAGTCGVSRPVRKSRQALRLPRMARPKKRRHARNA
nr:hypothetical protein [Macromonas bipunctata]